MHLECDTIEICTDILSGRPISNDIIPNLIIYTELLLFSLRSTSSFLLYPLIPNSLASFFSQVVFFMGASPNNKVKDYSIYNSLEYSLCSILLCHPNRNTIVSTSSPALRHLHKNLCTLLHLLSYRKTCLARCSLPPKILACSTYHFT